MDDKPSDISQFPEWLYLETLAKQATSRSTLTLFQRDSSRAEKFCADVLGQRLDFSKNNLDEPTLTCLLKLAQACQLSEWINRQRHGDTINHTECRSVLHTALRSDSAQPILVDRIDVMPEIKQEFEKMAAFVNAIHSDKIRGHTNQPFSDVVNIGIGGSDLGPRFVVDALRDFHLPNICCHFVSNVDDTDLNDVLENLNPETTLFLVASKTFTTQETMLNAQAARQWLIDALGDAAVASHFVALSTNSAAVEAFGIQSARQFRFWDWVGGRYSLWSCIGMSIALSIGMDGFRALLAGANKMDQHFYETPLRDNLPVLMALVGIWNCNFMGYTSLAVLPYDERLRLFPAYLQQLDMESNGKSIDRNGNVVSCTTGPLIWGGAGTNAQHSFMQSLHQGTQVIPVDFIAVLNKHQTRPAHHQALLANCFAQSEALLRGRASADLPPYKQTPGNRPSNTLLLDELTPESLGSLIALYEHKVFVQGVIWNINSFDQWGVEMGKQLGAQILQELQGDADPDCHDASTNGLIHAAKQS